MAEKQDSLATAEAAAIAAISTWLGFPVPPIFARNVLAATGALVVAAIDIPTALLQSAATKIRAESKARAEVLAGVVPAAIEAITTDDELKSRAAIYLGGKMLREQANREAVVQHAVEQLRDDFRRNPSAETDSPQPIDEDWLNIFGRLAESRSDQTMQAYFARILAGEIRRPGSFAPGTLEVLSRMLKADAENFQRLCALVMEFVVPKNSEAKISKLTPCIIAEPYGSPGNNKLEAVGFSYSDLCALQEAGLIQHDLTAWRQFAGGLFVALETRIGRTLLRFAPTEHADAKSLSKPNCINLTRAGQELFRIAHRETNEEYVDKIVAWIESSFSLLLTSREPQAKRS